MGLLLLLLLSLLLLLLLLLLLSLLLLLLLLLLLSSSALQTKICLACLTRIGAAAVELTWAAPLLLLHCAFRAQRRLFYANDFSFVGLPSVPASVAQLKSVAAWLYRYVKLLCAPRVLIPCGSRSSCDCRAIVPILAPSASV